MTCSQLVDNDVTRPKNIGWNLDSIGPGAGSLGPDDRDDFLGTAIESANVARGEGPEVKAGTFISMFGNTTTRVKRMPEQMM